MSPEQQAQFVAKLQRHRQLQQRGGHILIRGKFLDRLHLAKGRPLLLQFYLRTDFFYFYSMPPIQPDMNDINTKLIFSSSTRNYKILMEHHVYFEVCNITRISGNPLVAI